MDIVEVAVITTSLTTHKTGTGEGESLAPVQAQAHVPAHAQHTTARTYTVWIATWDAHVRLHTPRGGSQIRTRDTLARIIADKHAKGYTLATIMRWRGSGTYDLVFEHKSNPAYAWHMCGCAWMDEKAGRRGTTYAPVQEARE